jgi:hypothetical protein
MIMTIRRCKPRRHFVCGRGRGHFVTMLLGYAKELVLLRRGTCLGWAGFWTRRLNIDTRSLRATRAIVE